jgi:hypothetical protein
MPLNIAAYRNYHRLHILSLSSTIAFMNAVFHTSGWDLERNPTLVKSQYRKYAEER